MIPPVLQPIIRRAILDLVEDTGGELNDEMITLLLNELGHRVARSDVADEMRWLGEAALLRLIEKPAFIEARSTANGRDVAKGLLRHEGVSRHKTGE